MSRNATAAVVREPGGVFTLETVELDDLHAGEVFVRILAAGVCHTDMMAQFLTPLPAVMGHEGMGVVEEVGPAVEGFEPGDRVLISWPSCASCASCLSGEPYLCESGDRMYFSGRRLDGSQTMKLNGQWISGAFFQQSSFATRSIATARALVKLHDDGLEPGLLAALRGVMTGAGAVLNSLKLSASDDLAVIGAGGVGLSALMAARVVGVKPLVAVDVVPGRLALARELGATHTIDASQEDVAESLRAILPKGFRYVLDTTSRDESWNAGVKSLAMGGTLAAVNAPPVDTIHFEPLALMVKGGRFQFILGGSAIPRLFLPRLIEWHKQGIFPLDRLVKTFDFADINAAFAESQAGTAIKPVLLMPSV
jgi:aryl-alcohol dehydrogenase